MAEYEVFAIRYAERDARRSDHFIGGDPHDGPMPMDYFVWVAIAPHHTVVIDTGFTAEVAAARKRWFLSTPIEALAVVGGACHGVKDGALTHTCTTTMSAIFTASPMRSSICKRSNCITRPAATCAIHSSPARLRSRT